MMVANSGEGGSASGGDLNINGGCGTGGIRCFPITLNASRGLGGCSRLTTQSLIGFHVVGSTTPGNPGRFPGGGADGGANGQSQAVASGSVGGGGCIILKEYF
jgi:hypothetical protein